MRDSSSYPAFRRYSLAAIALHWLMAVLILANVVIVLVSEDLPRAEAGAWMAVHKANGISILLLALVRVGWRATHRWPPLPKIVPAWQAALARVTHAAFYVLMVAVPLAGWAYVSARSGRPVDMYGLFEFPALPIPRGDETAEPLEELHALLAFSTIGLVVLHVAGALKHLFGDKFFRMWPGRSAALPG